jgi:hypothetical protein
MTAIYTVPGRKRDNTGVLIHKRITENLDPSKEYHNILMLLHRETGTDKAH